MIDPMNFKFILHKTQGNGTENGSLDILDKVGAMGATYRDSTNRLVIIRINDNRILIIFRSGLSFELEWRGVVGNVWNLKVPQIYTAANKAHGIMGSTSEDFEECEFFCDTFSSHWIA